MKLKLRFTQLMKTLIPLACLCTAMLISLAPPPLSAQVVYQDSLVRSSGVQLNGTSPDTINSGGATWSATLNSFVGDGTATLASSPGYADLPLVLDGVSTYTFSVDMRATNMSDTSHLWEWCGLSLGNGSTSLIELGTTMGTATHLIAGSNPDQVVWAGSMATYQTWSITLNSANGDVNFLNNGTILLSEPAALTPAQIASINTVGLETGWAGCQYKNFVTVKPSVFAVNDGFTDGGRTDGTDPLDIAWYIMGAPFSLGVVDDSAGIGTGNALQLSPSGPWQGMQGNTPWFHLGDGDSLTLSFDYRFTGTGNLNEANKLHFGLYFDGGTLPTADNIWQIDNDDTGYYGATNPGLANSAGTSVVRAPAAGGTETTLGTAGSSISSGTSKHTATLTVRRSGTSITCSTSVDGQPAASGTDTVPVSYVFDEIYTLLGGTSATSPYLIDNVKLSNNQVTKPNAEGPPAGTWNLALDEEFNGTSLNTSVWSAGFRWASPMNGDISAMRPENVTVANGVCTIKAEKRTAQNMDMYGYQSNTMNYCSGAISTYNKWTQTYGYFEARLKMPASKGTWPAFWLMPDRGAQYEDYYRTSVGNTVYYPDGTQGSCPLGNEIDIFEHMGSWKNLISGISRLHSGYFWSYGSGGSYGDYAHQNGVLGNYVLGNPDGQFHNYGLYWAPGQLIYYIDGKVSMRRDNQTNVSIVPQYVILNCAVSTDDWTGTPVPQTDIDAGLPSNMVIDYVRVYTGTPNPAP